MKLSEQLNKGDKVYVVDKSSIYGENWREMRVKNITPKGRIRLSNDWLADENGVISYHTYILPKTKENALRREFIQLKWYSEILIHSLNISYKVLHELNNEDIERFATLLLEQADVLLNDKGAGRKLDTAFKVRAEELGDILKNISNLKKECNK